MVSKWNRQTKLWVFSLLAIILIVLIWQARALFPPLLIAALLAYILSPSVEFLTHRPRLSRKLAANLVYFISLGVLVAVPATFSPLLVDEIQTLTTDFQLILSQLENFLTQPIPIAGYILHLDSLIPDLEQFASELIPLTESAFDLVETVTRNAIWLLVVLVTTYYLLLEWPRLRDGLLQLTPPDHRSDARQLYQQIRQIWRGYLQGNLALMLVTGVMFTLAWLIIGVPGAVVLGIITGLLTIIPDVGPAIAAAIAILVALFEGSTYIPLSNFWFAVVVTGVYLVLINVKSIWIRPRLFGRTVHMHAGVVFVAIMAAVVIQGVLGALIVVPVLASLGVLLRYMYARLVDLPAFPDEQAGLEDPEATPEPLKSALLKDSMGEG